MFTVNAIDTSTVKKLEILMQSLIMIDKTRIIDVLCDLRCKLQYIKNLPSLDDIINSVNLHGVSFSISYDNKGEVLVKTQNNNIVCHYFLTNIYETYTIRFLKWEEIWYKNKDKLEAINSIIKDILPKSDILSFTSLPSNNLLKALFCDLEKNTCWGSSFLTMHDYFKYNLNSKVLARDSAFHQAFVFVCKKTNQPIPTGLFKYNYSYPGEKTNERNHSTTP